MLRDTDIESVLQAIVELQKLGLTREIAGGLAVVHKGDVEEIRELSTSEIQSSLAQVDVSLTCQDAEQVFRTIHGLPEDADLKCPKCGSSDQVYISLDSEVCCCPRCTEVFDYPGGGGGAVPASLGPRPETVNITLNVNMSEMLAEIDPRLLMILAKLLGGSFLTGFPEKVLLAQDTVEIPKPPPLVEVDWEAESEEADEDIFGTSHTISIDLSPHINTDDSVSGVWTDFESGYTVIEGGGETILMLTLHPEHPERVMEVVHWEVSDLVLEIYYTIDEL